MKLHPNNNWKPRPDAQTIWVSNTEFIFELNVSEMLVDCWSKITSLEKRELFALGSVSVWK